MSPPDKICATCGRSFEWRKKWERNWEEVRYCSQACRSNKPSETDEALESAIVNLLSARANGATICPSEAAKKVGEANWRDLMERARQAARRLVANGKVVITQKGKVVDPARAKGPIRIRRV